MTGAVLIERAGEATLPACFALLPALAGPDTVMLAARDADGSLLGAGGVVWRGWNTPAGMPCWLHVLPDSRRRGVGRKLLAALAALAHTEIDLLWALQPIDETADAAAFARACGATVRQRHLFFEARGTSFVDDMGNVLDRLRRAGRVPADICMVPLAEGDIDQVKWLIAEQMAAPPPRMGVMLQVAMTEPPATAPVDRERSLVLVTADGDVAGVLLTRRVPGENVSEVVCNVVDPRWRRGWANVMLLHGFTAVSAAQGCTTIRFDCADTVRDTIALAQRSGADHLRTEARFAYATAATDA